MILTHGANSLSKDITSIEIDGNIYPVVRIGNLYWITYNLDYKFPNYNTGNNMGRYYNDDEATYGWDGKRQGLLYDEDAIQYLETNKSQLLPNGWRVANKNDYEALITAVGGTSVAGKMLKSRSWDGDDSFGFNGVKTGLWSEGSFLLPDNGFFFTSTHVSGIFYNYYGLYNGVDSCSVDKTGEQDCLAIRLVKDDT